MSDPQTYEDALAQGYAPIEDMDAFLADHGLEAEEEARLSQFTKGDQVDCETALEGTKCFEWTYSNGTRKACFCTAWKSCGKCVFKKL